MVMELGLRKGIGWDEVIFGRGGRTLPGGLWDLVLGDLLLLGTGVDARSRLVRDLEGGLLILREL